MKKPVIAVSLLLLTGLGAAAQPDQITAQEGLINFEPGTALYPVETTVDNLPVVGQSKQLTISERTAEYEEQAEEEDAAGANSALQALNQSMKNAPAEAQDALQHAKSRVQSAPPPKGAESRHMEAVNAAENAQINIMQKANSQNRDSEDSGGSNMPDVAGRAASIFSGQ